CVEFNKALRSGLSEADSKQMFSRFSHYDAYSYHWDPRAASALNFFYTPEWFTFISGAFGIDVTRDTTANFHHHKTGSASGVVHNDYNLCSFKNDPIGNGANPWHYQCKY